MCLRDTYPKFQWDYQWVAPRCFQMAAGVLSRLVIRQIPRNADVSSFVMTGEPFAVGHVVSPNPRARRSYEPRRQDRLYRGTADPTKEPKYRPIPSHVILLRVAQAFDMYERAETNQAEIYKAASSRCQKCLLWSRCLLIWIPSAHFSIKAQEISRKSHMLWMSLKLQVNQAGRVSLSIDVVFNLSRVSSSCQELVGLGTPIRRLSFEH
ncbi:unnamed protein product [Penicillium nalgiovense]|nr:unnamed protein product [Penicillium nalgiovense]